MSLDFHSLLYGKQPFGKESHMQSFNFLPIEPAMTDLQANARHHRRPSYLSVDLISNVDAHLFGADTLTWV